MFNWLFQLAQLKVIPAKKEEDAKKLMSKLEKLQIDKQNEEDRFNEVMNSFQDETKVWFVWNVINIFFWFSSKFQSVLENVKGSPEE